MNALKVLVLIISIPLFGYEVSHAVKDIDARTRQVALTFTLTPGEYLYKESLHLTVNNPHVTLSPFVPSAEAQSFFDKASNRQRDGYTGTVTLSAKAEKEASREASDALIHAHFLVSSTKEPQETIVPLLFSKAERPDQPQKQPAPTSSTPYAATPIQQSIPCEVQQPSVSGALIPRIINYFQTMIVTIKEALTSLFTSTGSRVLRYAAALLLGIMLSLTPCLYPMIPITIGVLQSSGSSSTFKNFLLALVYTLGISTTFSLMGLIAALGSCVFGEIQGSPFIILPLALLLIYFGLAMLGFVQMYIPRFLQPKKSAVKGGSLLSAYVFGVISGTVASPCLSPGLVLILNYVTTISANTLIGYLESFSLLFMFGIGSSLPLLIIGIFSGSLNILPKAGIWMVEIQKLVGIMLISMAFYHLSHLERLLPWYLLVWVGVLSFVALGTFYFTSIDDQEKKWMSRYKNSMGIFLIVVACILAVQGERAVYDRFHPEAKSSPWLHSYEEAHDRAVKEHKPLFIDVGATYCSACKLLDKQIFAQEKIQHTLKQYIPLKIDADVHTDAYAQVKKRYGFYISGFPTYLIVNPDTGAVIKKWSVEINQLSLDGIVNELEKFKKLPLIT